MVPCLSLRVVVVVSWSLEREKEPLEKAVTSDASLPVRGVILPAGNLVVDGVMAARGDILQKCDAMQW